MKYNQESLISLFHSTHGDTYNYDKVVFIKLHDKVIITCKIHGDFSQTPNIHKSGSGCPSCGKSKAKDKLRKSKTSLLLEFKKKHGDTYNYDKVEYINANNKVVITCKVHGDFRQVVSTHLNGAGCRDCSRLRSDKERRKTADYYLDKFRGKHGDKYDYSKVDWCEEKIKVICVDHGVFYQTKTAHQKYGCPACGKLRPLKRSTRDVIAQFNDVHGGVYNYDKVTYTGMLNKVLIVCKEHGIFKQTPHSHFTGAGCPVCRFKKVAIGNTLTQDKTLEGFTAVHGDVYNYDKVVYVHYRESVIITCKTHGDFLQTPEAHKSGTGCPSCSHSGTSKGEIEMRDYIKSLLPNVEVIGNDRTVLSPKELDVYIPSLNVAFEYNGLFWHSIPATLSSSFSLHAWKFTECERRGIRLIQFTDAQWLDKKEICKSMIKSRVGKITTKIFARKCKVEMVTNEQARDFLEANHIQGKCGMTLAHGLYYEGVLCAVMCWKKPSSREGKGKGIESVLCRFCSSLNTSIAGGFTKLLSVYRKTHKGYIVSYADMFISNGGVYAKCGFEKVTVRKGYSYFFDGDLVPAQRFTKIKIKERFPHVYDHNLTESQMMEKLKINKYHSAGITTYILR